MPHKSLRIKAIAVIFLLFALLANGQPAASAPRAQAGEFANGDFLIAYGSGRVLWVDRSQNSTHVLTSDAPGVTAGLAFGEGGKILYVSNLQDASMVTFDRTGEYLGRFGEQKNPLVSLSVDRFGNIYGGEFTGGSIVELNATGNLVDSVYVGYLAKASENSEPSIPVWVDLAVDQHTIYFTLGERTVYRVDLSTSSQSPELVATLPDEPVVLGSPTQYAATAIRLLYPGDGSGGMLIADAGNIKRLDAFGNILRTYDLPEEDLWLSLSLDPDGKSFWAASRYTVYQFDLDTGAQLDKVNAGEIDSFLKQTDRIWGFLLVGEFSAAQPTPTWTPSITPSFTLHPPTITLTPKSFVPITETPPSSCNPPFCINIPTALVVAGIGIAILVAGVVVLALIVRGVRRRSAQRNRPQSKPTRTRVQGHPDAGEQSVIPSEVSSDLPSPQIRLKFEQGDSDYEVESDGE